MTGEQQTDRTNHCDECGDELPPIRKNTEWRTCMDCDGLEEYR